MASQEPDNQSRVSSSQVGGGNPMPFGQDKYCSKLKATSDKCGQLLHEMQKKLESLDQNMISAQLMVATSEGDAKTAAQQLFKFFEAD